MPDPYAAFTHLRIETTEPGVLEIVLDGPGLNAVDHHVHRELADVWLAVDRDPDTRVALLTGAGKAFSAGGSFEMLDEIINDYAARTHCRDRRAGLRWSPTVLRSRVRPASSW